MKHTLTSLAIAASLMSANALAEINLSGFASVVGGLTTSSDETLYEYDDKMDFKQDSLLALQASSDLGEGLGVTVQVAAKGADDWDPEFKWAFLSYDASDNLRILAGRQRVPVYMYSDFLDVSYAYPWIAPPDGVYDLVFDTFDGLGAIYNTTFGNVDATFHGIYGRNNDEFSGLGQDVDPEFNDMAGLAITLNYDWLTLRSAYFVTESTIPFSQTDDLSDAWLQLAASGFVPEPLVPEAVYIANNTRIETDDSSFLELGFQMNFDNLMIVGEYTDLEVENSPLAAEESYFVMAGYQFDDILVHLTYGVDDNTSSNYTTGFPYGFEVVPNPIAPTMPLDIRGVTEGLIASQVSEESYITLGLRYDFHSSTALKFEYTDFSDDNNSNRDAGLFRTALVTVF